MPDDGEQNIDGSKLRLLLLFISKQFYLHLAQNMWRLFKMSLQVHSSLL